MEYRAISFVQKFDLFHERWQPKVIAEMNDYRFKVVKLQGDFIWHHHNAPMRRSSSSKGICGSIFATARCMSGREKCSWFRRGWSTNRTPRTR